MTYLWLAAFLTSVMLFLILVPEESIRRFHVFGMVTGFLLGLVLLVLMTPVLGYWYFVPDFFTVAGMPLVLALAWWPLEILLPTISSIGVQLWTACGWFWFPPRAPFFFNILPFAWNCWISVFGPF